MDHHYIEEHEVASRYSMGKLPVEERREFEEHFVDCPRCLDQLEVLENLRSGLKQVAAEDAGKSPGRAASPGWLAAWRGWPSVAIAAAACVLVALSVVLVWQMARLRGKLDRSELASIDAERRLELQQRENGVLQHRLQNEQAAGAAIFLLNTARSPDRSAAPENRITISPGAQWVVLSLERDYEPEYREYRATLSDASGRTVWQQEHLIPASPTSLGIVLASNLFHSGDYELKLEGVTRDGRYLPAAHYRIRASLKN